jgi:hypothetical protein
LRINRHIQVLCFAFFSKQRKAVRGDLTGFVISRLQYRKCACLPTNSCIENAYNN